MKCDRVVSSLPGKLRRKNGYTVRMMLAEGVELVDLVDHVLEEYPQPAVSHTKFVEIPNYNCVQRRSLDQRGLVQLSFDSFCRSE